MPRRSAHTPDSLAQAALTLFWERGYHATSMEDLVHGTGISRHGIYAMYGGKLALYLACFGTYTETVVNPAFGVVEAPGADAAAMGQYFETQIQRAEQTGLPGPGCFIANAATELAPACAPVMARVRDHDDRLRAGFLNVLQRHSENVDADLLDDLAGAMVVFTNGLWSASRTVNDGEALRRRVTAFLDAIERRLA